MVAVYFGAQLIKGGGGDAGHDGPNLHKLSNLAQLRLALPEPARELPGTPLSGWKRAGQPPRWGLQARTPRGRSAVWAFYVKRRCQCGCRMLADSQGTSPVL